MQLFFTWQSVNKYRLIPKFFFYGPTSLWIPLKVLKDSSSIFFSDFSKEVYFLAKNMLLIKKAFSMHSVESLVPFLITKKTLKLKTETVSSCERN